MGILDVFNIGGEVNHGDIDIISWHLFKEELDLDAIWAPAQSTVGASIMETPISMPAVLANPMDGITEPANSNMSIYQNTFCLSQ